MPTPFARRLREGGYLLTTLATGLAALPAVWMLAASAATVLAAGIGLALFPLALYGVRRWGEAERRRAGRLLGEATTADPRLRRRRLLPRLREVVTSRPARRGVGWLLVHATVGTLAGLVGLVAELVATLRASGVGKELAIASGPWAPRGIEERANAFAAMFLMPTELVRAAVADVPDPITELRGPGGR